MYKNKKIKFFISSTFKDFEVERNILQKFVFPKLKELCHVKGFGFQPIDLRWGVKEEAGYDQQTMNICLNEIKRSSSEPKPNLLLLVGQRYGWVPIPYDIKEDEFDEIIKSDKLTLNEKQLIKEWYKKDKNSIPTTYYLQSKWRYKDDRDAWTIIEASIRNAFQKATKLSRYHTSATEQEMYEGLDAFSKDVNHSHTYAYFRKIDQYDINDNGIADYIDIKDENGKNQLNLEKLNNLKNRLQKVCNIPEKNQINGDNKYNVLWEQITKAKEIKYEDLTLENVPEYLKKFYDDILEKFETSIRDEIENFEESTKLEIELEQQKLFLKRKSETVLGRDKEVKKIINFLECSEQYYLQYGRSGTGKTSVVAKVISEIDTDRYEVISRFIGTTASSTYARQLFENIYWEIESKIQDDEKLSSPAFEYEDDKFKKQFQAKLNEYQELINKPLILFLDAVDQFEDKNDLTIILDDLPQNIKVVFSCLYDESKKENDDYYWYYNRLEYLQEKNNLTQLSDEDRSNQEIMINILDKWLEKIKRKLTNDQKTHLKEYVLSEHSTPLYLKLVYEIVKHWKSDEKKLSLAKDEKGLIYQFFDFIVKDYHHEEILLTETMGYISASKDGLSEEELIDLFSRNNSFLETFQNHRYPKLDRLPNAIWSRFYYYIQDLFTEKLIDGEMLICSFHRIIQEAIEEKYYDKNYHGKLASYFYTLQNSSKTWDKRYNNLHMLSEYPYQLLRADNSHKLKEILLDLEFAGSIYDNNKEDAFRDIMSKATSLNGIKEDEIYPWESFFREKDHSLTTINEKVWKPHQSLFQLAYEDGENSPITKEAEKLLNENKIDFNWLKRQNRDLLFQREGLVSKLYFNNVEDVIVWKKNLLVLNNSKLKVMDRKLEQVEKVLDFRIIENITVSEYYILVNYKIGLLVFDTNYDIKFELKDFENYIAKCCFIGDLVYFYDDKSNIYEWNLEKNTLNKLSHNHINRVKEIELIGEKSFYTYDGDIFVLWDYGEKLSTSLFHNVNEISYHKDNYIVLLDNDNRLIIIDKMLKVTTKENKSSHDKILINNKCSFYTYNNKSICLWKVDGTLIKEFIFNSNHFIKIFPVDDSTIVVDSYKNGMYIIESLKHPKGHISKHFKTFEKNNFIFCLNNFIVFIDDESTSIYIWNYKSLKLIELSEAFDMKINFIKKIDELNFIIGYDKNYLKLYNLNTILKLNKEIEKSHQLISHNFDIKHIQILSENQIVSLDNEELKFLDKINSNVQTYKGDFGNPILVNQTDQKKLELYYTNENKLFNRTIKKYYYFDSEEFVEEFNQYEFEFEISSEFYITYYEKVIKVYHFENEYNVLNLSNDSIVHKIIPLKDKVLILILDSGELYIWDYHNSKTWFALDKLRDKQGLLKIDLLSENEIIFLTEGSRNIQIYNYKENAKFILEDNMNPDCFKVVNSNCFITLETKRLKIFYREKTNYDDIYRINKTQKYNREQYLKDNQLFYYKDIKCFEDIEYWIQDIIIQDNKILIIEPTQIRIVDMLGTILMVFPVLSRTMEIGDITNKFFVGYNRKNIYTYDFYYGNENIRILKNDFKGNLSRANRLKCK